MNTRLQVEHPVTELVTGIDLVEQMIRVAAGEKLSLKQKDVRLTGWAVESRVYAEDPFRNFLPSIGRLVKYRPPLESSVDGITVRNDTGVQEGGEISIYYDPMIAKLVTHAPSRAAAIEAQATALDSFYIDGIRHNIPFLSALMLHPRWREGKLSTGFIAEEFPKGFAVRVPEGEIARRLAAVGAAIDHVLGERKRQISGQLTGRPVQRERRRAVWLDRAEIPLDVTREADGIAVRFIGADGALGNPHLLVSPWTPGDPVWQGTIDGHPVAMQVRAIPNGFRLAHQGYEVAVNVFTEIRGHGGAADAGRHQGRYRQEAAVPDAGACGVDRRQRRPGGQGRRDAGRGRGDEDAERAARRTRRHGEEDPRRSRRHAGGRRADPGIRLSNRERTVAAFLAMTTNT